MDPNNERLNNTLLFSNTFIKLNNSINLNKQPKNHYKGQISVTLSYLQGNISKTSKKWHFIEFVSNGHKKEFMICPEKFSLSKKRRDHYIYFTQDNKTIYASVQCILNSKMYVRMGSSTNKLNNKYFDEITFNDKCTKINISIIEGKAICNDLTGENKFYATKYFF